MNHALAVISTSLGIVFALVACSDNEYAEVRQIMQQQVELISKTTKSLNTARNVADVVAEVDRFCAAMEQLVPSALQIQAGSPQVIEAIARNRTPAPLKPVLRRLDELKTGFFEAAPAMIRFAGDPQLEAARRKFEKAVQSVTWRQKEIPD